MELFKKYFHTTKYGFVDVFKEMRFSDEIMATEDYTVHEINEDENLMSISYDYYETVDDWWALFVFNKFDNYMFTIPNEKIINDTVEFYRTLLINYEESDKDSQFLLKSAVRSFFNSMYDFRTAIRRTAEVLGDESERSDEIFMIDFSQYIYNDVILKSTYTTKIKIPSLQVIYKMKNELKRLSLDWESQSRELGEI